MKVWNAIIAVIFLMMLGASSCATLSGPMTEEEEEEVVKVQNERWPKIPLRELGDE
jgi:hypothetical protein